MLPKKYRIRRDEDFQKMYKTKGMVAHPLLRAKKRWNEYAHPRFGIIISTKTAKKAKDRNLIKRRIRAILSRFASSIQKNLDIIFIAQPKIIGQESWQIQEAIEELLRKMHVPLSYDHQKYHTTNHPHKH